MRAFLIISHDYRSIGSFFGRKESEIEIGELNENNNQIR